MWACGLGWMVGELMVVFGFVAWAPGAYLPTPDVVSTESNIDSHQSVVVAEVSVAGLAVSRGVGLGAGVLSAALRPVGECVG